MKLISAIFASLHRRIELSRYNDFTIAEYFRKQGAQIGENCSILIRSFGSEPYLVQIGNHCRITAGVTLVTHDGGAWIFTDELPTLQRFGYIQIMDNCFIGINATIMPGVRIGPNSVVGAGAVVTKDVPPGMVVAGCPAVAICTIAEYRDRLVAHWERQRPQGYLEDLMEGTRYSAAHIDRRKRAAYAQLRDHLTKTLGVMPN